MFGYVKPVNDELKIREYNVFRSYYCGLCKALGENYNQLTRFGLNYDLTFLAVIIGSLIENDGIISNERCFVHPLKKRNIMKNSQSIDYASDMSVLLVRLKLKDDWNDDKSYKALLASIPYRNYDNKLLNQYPETVKSVEMKLSDLSKLEKDKSKDLDACADKFAKVMESIFQSPIIKDDTQKRILGQVGYYLGRWIYIVDAYQDLEADIKTTSFNPLLLKYYEGNETINVLKDKVKQEIEVALYYTLSQLVDCYELLDIKNNKEIIDNVLYLGLRNKMESIFSNCCKEEK